MQNAQPDFNFSGGTTTTQVPVYNMGLLAGSNVTLSTSGVKVTISSTSVPVSTWGVLPGSFLTSSTSGNQITLDGSQIGTKADTFGLVAGNNISIGTSARNFTLNYTGPTSGSSLGILAGANITVSTSGSVVTINSVVSTGGTGGGLSVGLDAGIGLNIATSGQVVTYSAPQIATKADITTLNSYAGTNTPLTKHIAELSTAATNTRVTNELATKSDLTTLTNQLGTKANSFGLIPGANTTFSTAGNQITINSAGGTGGGGSALGLAAGVNTSLSTSGSVVTINNTFGLTNVATSTYELVLGDANGIVQGATLTDIVIPTNSKVSFPIPTTITVTNVGSGQVTISGTTGVTLNGLVAGTVYLLNQYGGVPLYKNGTDSWIALVN